MTRREEFEACEREAKATALAAEAAKLALKQARRDYLSAFDGDPRTAPFETIQWYNNRWEAQAGVWISDVIDELLLLANLLPARRVEVEFSGRRLEARARETRLDVISRYTQSS